MKFTAKSVQLLSVPAGKSEAIFFDDDVPGFGLRLRAGGSRTWIFQFKIVDAQRRVMQGRIKLGSAKGVTLEVARDGYTGQDKEGRPIKIVGARHYHSMVMEGRNPQSEKSDAKAALAETFEAVGQLFLAYERVNLRPSSYKDVERHILTHAKTLHQLQLAKIDRQDIAILLATISKNSGAVTGNRVRTTLSTFFGWAIGEGVIDANPVINTNKNKERTRARVLSPDELRLIWRALGSDDFAAIMRLLALTGQRAGEIARLRWSELRDLEIMLPGERTKNHLPHTVPLSEAARAILAPIATRPRRVNAGGKVRDLVFGNGEGPFSGWSNCKEALDARMAKLNGGTALEHWTPHDLRRSFATHAAETVGIQPHIIEAVLNHVSGHRAGVAGIYNRAAYEPEKRAALARWADQLLAWVESRDTNVTTLRAAS